MKLTYISITVAALMLTACASTDRGQRTVGVTETDMSSTEAMFDAESIKATALLQRSGSRIRDAELETYVQDVATKSAGEFGDEVNVYLLKAPAFNAYMYPNGTMGVYSGLLLRVETEDELALVLGHEFGHYYEKHSLEIHAKAENASHASNAASHAISAFSLLTVPVGVGIGGELAGIGTQIAILADVFSFSREQESEADVIGLERVTAIGYDKGAAIRLWDNLDKEKKASSIPEVRNRKSKFYDSHPTSPDRLEALKVAANIQGDIPRASREQRSDYRAHIRPYLMAWLDAEIARRDAGATLNLLDRLDDLGEDKGVLLYARARVLDRALSNKKLKEDELTQRLVKGQSQIDVIELLKQASSHQDAPPVVHRELGDSLYKLGQYKDAKSAFQRYLVFAPNAADRQLIQSLIAKMDTAS